MSFLTLLFPGGLNTYPLNVVAQLRAQISSTEVPPLFLPGSIQSVQVSQQFNCTFTTSGTGADQVDRPYVATLAFVAGQPQSLDLTNLRDPYQNVITFARIRRIILKVKSTTDGATLKLGYATTTVNAWTSLVSNPGQITLQASSSNNDGGIILMAPNATGWVVGSTNKLLQLDPGSSGFAVDIEILGASV